MVLQGQEYKASDRYAWINRWYVRTSLNIYHATLLNLNTLYPIETGEFHKVRSSTVDRVHPESREIGYWMEINVINRNLNIITPAVYTLHVGRTVAAIILVILQCVADSHNRFV